VRTIKQIMQYCQDEIYTLSKKIDEAHEHGVNLLEDYGELVGRRLAYSDLLKKLRKSHPKIRLKNERRSKTQ
jgi:uncharacterized coiled-coil DUF342 family protein